MADSAAAAGLPAGVEKSETAKQSIEDKIVIRMRKCGRYLLKDSAEVSRAESGELLSCLDAREKKCRTKEKRTRQKGCETTQYLLFLHKRPSLCYRTLCITRRGREAITALYDIPSARSSRSEG